MKPHSRGFIFRPVVGLMLLAALLLAVVLAWAFLPHGHENSRPVAVEIKTGSGLRSIARELERHTEIFAPGFVALAWLTGKAQRLRAGVYEVQPHDTPWRILDKLARGEARLEKLTVLEGWTFAQMRASVERHPALRVEFKNLSDTDLLQALGLSLPYLEGWFFPDTYWFAAGTTDRQIYKLAHQAMQRELDAAWQQRRADTPLAKPEAALVLASIVEKETGLAQDRAQVAAVFNNRLRIGMRLQTDPSVIYGLGASFDGNLRKRDLETDTPYNTYTRAGLPPTPIALPGRAALLAAVNPAPSKALYFVARGDGSSQFSATLEHHNAAVSRYQLKKN